MAKGITELITDFKELHPRAYGRIYQLARANALDDFQKWLSTQIVGVDDKTKEILVVKEDRWELAIDVYKEII